MHYLIKWVNHLRFKIQYTPNFVLISEHTFKNKINANTYLVNISQIYHSIHDTKAIHLQKWKKNRRYQFVHTI